MKNKRAMRTAYVEGNVVRKGDAARRMPDSAKPVRGKKRAKRLKKKEQRLLYEQRKARKQLQYAQKKEQQRLLHEREMDHRALQERLRGKAVPLDGPFLWVLIFASSLTLYLCFHYIQLKTEINARVSSIERKEQELEKLRSENDALENSINTSIDLDEVYRVATEELGMVYANEDQVITFDKSESEYVRQYEKIPKY